MGVSGIRSGGPTIPSTVSSSSQAATAAPASQPTDSFNSGTAKASGSDGKMSAEDVDKMEQDMMLDQFMNTLKEAQAKALEILKEFANEE
jgi:hypothetical protein